MNIAGLPGAEFIAQGLDDLAADVESDAALLVQIGAPRLQRLGVAVPVASSRPDAAATAPEHRLYARLAQLDADAAHSRYNALIRTLVSFERAAACAG